MRHVSLGDDLQRYNYGIPEMPRRWVLDASRDMDVSPFVRASFKQAVNTRLKWELATGPTAQRFDDAA